MSLQRMINVTSRGAAAHSRVFSTACSDALNKFRGAVEDYRIQHYQQELPSRCKKEVLKAATQDNDGLITIEGIETLLVNIGAEKKVSRSDVEIILSEIGQSGSNRTIRMDEMLQVL